MLVCHFELCEKSRCLAWLDMTNTYQKIYEIVNQIPKGEVRTYKQVAELAGTHPRVVGNALHKNPDSSTIPCHRVVSTTGALAKHFAFGGLEGQTKLLKSEGVTVVKEHAVINQL